MVHAYDAKPSTSDAPWSLFSSEIGGVTLQNVEGRLAAVASRSARAWQVTLFSYDQEGHLARRHTFSQNMAGTGVIAAANSSDSVVVNLQGQPVERRLTVGTLTFNHWYEHTGRGLLGRAYASTSSGKPSTPDAAYSYRPSGAVATGQVLGGSEVPLLYTVREELETIGDPAGTAHPFSARYRYHPNGWVSESEFYSAGAPGGGAATANRYRYLYGVGSYDGLGRLLGATYQGWTGSWSSTLAHNLTGITYDPSGNITAMRRYREDATLIDDLTYSYPGSSNRLSSVTDAVPATLGWDAQSGSFTYDANGNMTSSPAPYSVTGATYDHRNLPTALVTVGADTTWYRYDHAGQRTAKRVGAGHTQVYLLDGTVTLGVVTLDGAGAVVEAQFNVIADGQVVGRQEVGGARLHYHRDLLGSTRAVTEGATVVESYDFDPWGVLMPGRVLVGTTREGFTTKERDGETGLDYFGARYYMAALGRWTSVDPPAGEFPEWSPYNYVKNNPAVLWDPDGLCPRWAGGDGEASGLENCPEGSVGWRVHQVEERFRELAREGTEAFEGFASAQCLMAVGGFGFATAGTVAFGAAGVRIAVAGARAYGHGLVARGLAQSQVKGLEGAVQASIATSQAHLSVAGIESALIAGAKAEVVAGLHGQMAAQNTSFGDFVLDALPLVGMIKAGERVAQSCGS